MQRMSSAGRMVPIAVLAGLGLVAGGSPARAVPSFAGQTGQPCSTCHVGGFGPQLTPFGEAFKISGYTQQGGDGWDSQFPLSGMVMGSFTNTAKSLPAGTQTRHYGLNNNPAIDQISVFLAGRLGEHTGGFGQFTYSPIDGSVAVDNMDLRPYVTTVSLGGKDVVVGISVNNSPTVQDPFNTTFAWGYPYIASSLAPTPAAGPVLAGAFAQNTIGYTAYLWYDRSLYLEAGFYQTMTPWMMARVGSAYGPGAATGVMPYLRAAYQWDWNNQTAHIGGIFMQANLNPAAGDRVADGSMGQDHYTDYALDAAYSYLGDGTNVVTVQGIYTHEVQDLAGTVGAANAANGTSYGTHYQLDFAKLDVSYWYRHTYGVTLGWQSVWGSANPVLYQPGPVGGSANGRPDSTGLMAEADWVPFGKDGSWGAPWANLKLGAQFTHYTRFNGGTGNYDGSGRSASANDTLYLFAWTLF